MAITSLNMTAVSRDIFPSLAASFGPVLDSTVRVINDPMAKSVDVNIFAERTGAEFTQATANYTATAASTSAVTVTFTEVYDYLTMNKLSFNQTPVDVIQSVLPSMGRAIGGKMFAMQNALVLAATFTNTATTSTAANFDADDVADLATSLSTAKASKIGRYAVIPPTTTGLSPGRADPVGLRLRGRRRDQAQPDPQRPRVLDPRGFRRCRLR